MVMIRHPFLLVAWLLICASVCACGRPAIPAAAPSASLVDESGATQSFRELAARAPFTVVVFFSASCPVQVAHDERLRALYDRYHARGVQFLAVDSEVGATPERDAGEAKSRGYAFPIWIDRGAAFADAMHAEYATFTVVVDRDGRVRYAGGIDSDRAKLHDDARVYVADALDDLLAGREPRQASGKTLGCALRKS
jgi:peroxiredoxin